MGNTLQSSRLFIRNLFNNRGKKLTFLTFLGKPKKQPKSKLAKWVTKLNIQS